MDSPPLSTPANPYHDGCDHKGVIRSNYYLKTILENRTIISGAFSSMHAVRMPVVLKKLGPCNKMGICIQVPGPPGSRKVVELHG
jgi:hypothetical protein